MGTTLAFFLDKPYGVKIIHRINSHFQVRSLEKF
jgi:hypothetical protein